jgi:hypothetical protein
VFVVFVSCVGIVHFNPEPMLTWNCDGTETKGAYMPINEPYVTVAVADTINISQQWVDATGAEKETALQWGRVYLDANYRCNLTIDPLDVPEAIQYANAVFGEYSILGILYPTAGERGTEKTTIEESVSAGSVSVSEKFETDGGGRIIENDPFNNISQMLENIGCRYIGGSGGAVGGPVPIYRGR